MGILNSPQEAAPAYEDVVHNHPMNRFTPSSSSSGYASVPQEDIENDAPAHNHGGASSSSSSSAPQAAAQAQPGETIAQTIAGVFRKEPHTHCEACDKANERRELRANERHCCAMVGSVFIALFFCIMILGIVIAGRVAKVASLNHAG